MRGSRGCSHPPSPSAAPARTALAILPVVARPTLAPRRGALLLVLEEGDGDGLAHSTSSSDATLAAVATAVAPTAILSSINDSEPMQNDQVYFDFNDISLRLHDIIKISF
jgi:hypothetical protein